MKEVKQLIPELIDILPVLEDTGYKKYITFTGGVNGHVFNVFSDYGIYSDEQWIVLLSHVCAIAGKEDTINFHLTSTGGEIYTALRVINLINNCKAKCHITVTGVCASAATLITFMPTWESITIDDSSMFLFHTARTLNYGKVNDVAEDTNALNNQVKYIYNNFYSKILTKEEIDRVIDGFEHYILGAEVNERIRMSPAKYVAKYNKDK